MSGYLQLQAGCRQTPVDMEPPLLRLLDAEMEHRMVKGRFMAMLAHVTTHLDLHRLHRPCTWALYERGIERRKHISKCCPRDPQQKFT